VKFQWPELLWLLALAPVLVALYVALLRRRKRLVVRFADVALFREAIGPGQRLRRHLPPALFLLALLGLIVAVARPTAVITLPAEHELVVLAMDVSGSMRAGDVQPTRLAAAQAAARAFVEELPASTRVAVVSFAATAQVAQPATGDRGAVLDAIDRFQLQRGTAIGSAILVSLKQIFPDVEYDLRSENPRPRRGEPRDPWRDGAAGSRPAPEPIPPGSYTAATIVLLGDGQATAGPDPLESARMAAERGVRVFTVGVGTPKGETLSAEGWSMRVRLDEQTLQSIARITRGAYLRAETAADLKEVYRGLSGRLVFERRETEVTAIVSLVAAALALLAATISLLWFGRFP
jgi:Ca-activated chloride channel family protein